MASLTEITGVLGRNRAAHLLRRATFGPTIPEIDQFAALTATQALALLLDDTAVNPLPPIDLLTGSTWVDPTGVSGPPLAGSGNSEQDQLFEYFQAWHMDVMRKAPLTLKERALRLWQFQGTIQKDLCGQCHAQIPGWLLQ